MEQEQLKEELYKIIEVVAEGIVILDREGTVVFANPKAQDLLGIGLADLLGREFPNRIWRIMTFKGKPFPEEERPFRRVISTGRAIYGVEYVFEKPDGAQAIVSVNATPFIDKQGKVESVVLSLIDITGLKLAVDEVRESRKKVLDILESISDGFFALDNDWRFTYVNHNAELLLGKRKEELLYRNIWEVFPEAVGTKFYNEFKKSKEEMIPASFEEFYSPLNKWFEVHVYPYKYGLSGYFSDISKRKDTERGLKESEERFRKIFEEGPLGIALNTLDYKFIKVNARLCQMLGYTEQELQNMTFIDITYPEDVDKDVNLAKKLIAGEIPYFQIEKRYVRKNGEVFWILLTASIIRDERGNPLYGLGMIEDISERKKVEEELQFKSMLLDSVIDSVFVLTPDGRMIYVNEAAYKDRGYTKEELLSLPLDKIDAPEYVKLEKPRIDKLLQTGSAIFEAAHLKKDGSIMPVEIHAQVIEHKGEKVIVSVARDISVRRAAEERLKESEQKLRDITSVLGEGVYVLDENGCLTFMNPEAERILGWSEKELLGKNIHEVIHHHGLAGTRIPVEECPVLRVTREGRAYRTEEDVFTRKDGTTIPVAYVSTPIVKKRKIVGAVTAFQDITQRKRARELSEALNNINAAMTSTLDPHKIMQRIVVEAAEAIGSETAGIMLREGEYWVSRYAYKFPPEKTGARFTAREVPHVVLAAKTRRPVVINDAYNDPRVNPDIQRRYGIRSVLVIPLIVRENVIGAILFNYHSRVTEFTDEAVDFASKLAASVSLALENAHLYEVERNIADTLQEALLVMPAQVEGIRFGHLYRSATEATRVGGDFFDIFEVEHGKVGIVIGDVSGKGLGAATLTSLVKNTIKAHAFEDGTPALIMAKTNDLVSKFSPPADFATVFFGVLDTDTGNFVYCSAGHPPAIIKRATSSAELLLKHSPIIGAFPGLHYRSGKASISEGDMLVLYTDGVIEARSNASFFGEERLVNFVGQLKKVTPEEMPGVIFNEVMKFTGGVLSDDIAILVVSLGSKPNQK